MLPDSLKQFRNNLFKIIYTIVLKKSDKSQKKKLILKYATASIKNHKYEETSIKKKVHYQICKNMYKTKYKINEYKNENIYKIHILEKRNNVKKTSNK